VGAVTVLRHRLAPCLAVLAGLALSGCGSSGTGPSGPTSPAIGAPSDSGAAFTAGGVHVTIALGTGVRPTLVARFRPVKDGFHLYSAHLPVGGVEGLGQRTSLEPAGAIHAAGPLRMSEPVHKLLIRPLHLTLPVYPDGPVTARLAVRRTGDGAARVSISYAACSNRVCYVPVHHYVVALG
jgi:hypothetical protein